MNKNIEKSYGAVVYKQEGNLFYFLCVKHLDHHVSYPKGHVEKLEKETETACREIKEETNIEVRIDDNFKRSVFYNPKPHILKETIYFLGEAINSELIIQEEELMEANWYPFEDAYALVTYANDKDVLSDAYAYLKMVKCSAC